MKTLFWKKFDKNCGIWSVHDDAMAKKAIDEKFLLSLFEVKKVDPARAAEEKRQKQQQQQQAGGGAAPSVELRKSAVFQGQRLQNIGITLKRLKAPKEVVSRALIACDRTVLTDDILELLLSILPTPEDLQKLELEKKRGGVAWTSVEEYLYYIGSTVLDARERVQLLQASIEFDDMLKRATKSIANLEAAVAVASSKQSKLSSTLRMILLIGNLMNRGSNHGNAVGFRLETLSNLSFVKSVDAKTTLMEVLVLSMATSAPELLDFPKELSKIHEVANCPFHSVSQHVAQLNMTLQRMKRVAEDQATGKQCRVVLPADSDGLVDGLPQVLLACTRDHTSTVAQLALRHQALREDLRTLMETYGEDPNAEESVIWNFLTQFGREFEAARESLKRSKKTKDGLMAASMALPSAMPEPDKTKPV